MPNIRKSVDERKGLYYSDLRGHGPQSFVFQTVVPSQHEEGQVVAILKDGRGADRHLVLDSPEDARRLSVVARGDVVQLECVGTVAAPGLAITYQGRRIDALDEARRSILGTPPAAERVSMAALAQVYAKAFREAVGVGQALEATGATGFEVARCASDLFQAYVARRRPDG